MKFVERDELFLLTLGATIYSLSEIHSEMISEKVEGIIFLVLWFGYHFIYKNNKIDSRYLMVLVIIVIYILFCLLSWECSANIFNYYDNFEEFEYNDNLLTAEETLKELKVPSIKDLKIFFIENGDKIQLCSQVYTIRNQLMV